MTEPHVTISTTHLLTVAVGKVGLCKVNTTAHFLEPGIHRINSPRFEFLGFSNSTDEHIQVGSKNRIVVPSGKGTRVSKLQRSHYLSSLVYRVPFFLRFSVGLGWENGTPLLLETGKTYNIDSPTFSYIGSQFINAPTIKHGSINIITVKQGQAGISYDQGSLNVLSTGRHMLTGATQLFAGFLSLGQQVLKISQVVSMTSDNVRLLSYFAMHVLGSRSHPMFSPFPQVGISFDAAVSIQVVDPLKAVTMLCPVQDDSRVPFSVAQMHSTIVEKAKLGLSIIIGNNRLNATFKATQRMRPSARRGPFSSDDLLDTQSEMLPPHVTGATVQASPTPATSSGDPEAESSHDSFKQHVHDVFMHSFSEQMLNDCGIHVQEMSIEDVTITNAELAHAMAQGAVARTGLIKAQIDLEITKTQALAEQTAEVLRAQGHAKAIGILAEADADRISKLDEAMSRVCATTQQRELVRASGEVLKDSKSTILLAHSAVDVASLLSGPVSMMAAGATRT
jgi:regulator of protease activity HflC (stomatin/prohibitin superfamily)